MKKSLIFLLVLLLFAVNAAAAPVCFNIINPGSEDGEYSARVFSLDLVPINAVQFSLEGTGTFLDEYPVLGSGQTDGSVAVLELTEFMADDTVSTTVLVRGPDELISSQVDSAGVVKAGVVNVFDCAR